MVAGFARTALMCWARSAAVDRDPEGRAARDRVTPAPGMHAIRIMANQPIDGRDLQKQRSTERYGLGQSGYTAGRREADRALERNIEARNRGYPRRYEERMLDLGDDERWIGGGGSQWYPDAPDALVERGAHGARPSP
jgi:hypothetical protein